MEWFLSHSISLWIDLHNLGHNGIERLKNNSNHPIFILRKQELCFLLLFVLPSSIHHTIICFIFLVKQVALFVFHREASSKVQFKPTIIKKIFERNSGFHVKYCPTGKVNFYFREFLASIKKCFIFAGRLDTSL